MKPKKSLGQNFLTQKSVVQKIIKAAKLNAGDTVVEIGPGKGILTEEILKIAKKTIAIEKDKELAELLLKKFEKEIKENKLQLIIGDITDFETETLAVEYKIIANIPYFLTGKIIKKFLTASNKPGKMTLMVQKEVALRIARNEKESILSISVKAYGKPKYIETVKAGSFFPKPKIDSAILLIDEISNDFFADMDEKKFFELLRAGFQSKRKTLLNNLKGFAKEKSLRFEGEIFEKNIRPEELSINDWKDVFNKIYLETPDPIVVTSLPL